MRKCIPWGNQNVKHHTHTTAPAVPSHTYQIAVGVPLPIAISRWVISHDHEQVDAGVSLLTLTNKKMQVSLSLHPVSDGCRWIISHTY